MASNVNQVEKILADKLKEGDKDVFSLIFQSYYKDLVHFALNFVHETSASEEIVQETFSKLWEERDLLNIDHSLRSFLLKSVRNRCIDQIRHQKVRQNHFNDIIQNPLDYECNTDSYIANSELEHLIESALEKLSAEVSQTYRMNRFEGLKYNEIAEKLNVSRRTVEVRIGKALCTLREELHDYLI